MNKYIFHKNSFSTEELNLIDEAFSKIPVKKSSFYALESNELVELSAIREQLGCDVSRLEASFDAKAIRLFVTDMDSTFISIECIDEIADMLGIKAQVSGITEAASARGNWILKRR